MLPLQSIPKAVPLFGKLMEIMEEEGGHVSKLFYSSASGTEDAVRVYAEAATRAETDELAYKISLLVFNEAGGVGKPPMMP